MKKKKDAEEEIVEEQPFEGVREFHARRATTGSVSTVLRHKETGGVEFCTSGDPTAIDEGFVQERYGGGKYTFRLRKPNGEYGGQYTVEIAAPPEGSALPLNPDPAGDGFRLQVDLLRDQLARQQEMVLHLIDKNSAPPAGGNDLVKVIEAVAALRSFADPSAQIKSAVTALSEGIKLGMRNGNGNTGGDDKLGSIFRVVDKVSEMLPRLRAFAPGNGVSPGAGPPGNGNGNAPEDPAKLLQGTIAYLKTKISKDPALWADMIWDNLEESHWSLVASLIERPYDEIAERIGDPDLKREPYRSWFLKLIEELKLARTSEGDLDPKRETRDRSGTSENE